MTYDSPAETGSPTGQAHPFEPDYAVHPGELLREALDEAGMTQAHLARECGVTAKHVNQIVQGKQRLHAPFAVAAEVALGYKYAHILMRIQSDFDVFHERARVITNAVAAAKLLARSADR